jgi:hypothetical protein
MSITRWILTGWKPAPRSELVAKTLTGSLVLLASVAGGLFRPHAQISVFSWLPHRSEPSRDTIKVKNPVAIRRVRVILW